MISAQVLNEFTNVARRKRRREWVEIEAAITVVRDQFPEIVPITAETHRQAVALAGAHGFAFYDALIVSAALEAGCDTLVTEDLQHARAVGGRTILNPFQEDAA